MCARALALHNAARLSIEMRKDEFTWNLFLHLQSITNDDSAILSNFGQIINSSRVGKIVVRTDDIQSEIFSNLLIRRSPSHDGQFIRRGRWTQAKRPILPFIAFETPETDVRIDAFGIILWCARMIARSSACDQRKNIKHSNNAPRANPPWLKLTRICLQTAAGLFNATIHIEVGMSGRSENAACQNIRMNDIDKVGLFFGQFVFGRCKGEQRLCRIQTSDAWQFSRFHIVRNHSSRLSAQTESNYVQIFQRKHRFAHHEIQQLGRALGNHWQIVNGLNVARFRHQRSIVNGNDTVFAMFQYFRTDFGVWREISVSSVSMKQNENSFASAEHRRRHCSLVRHIQLRWTIDSIARVQIKGDIRIWAFVVGNVALQEFFEWHVWLSWAQDQQNWKRTQINYIV